MSDVEEKEQKEGRFHVGIRFHSTEKGETDSSGQEESYGFERVYQPSDPIGLVCEETAGPALQAFDQGRDAVVVVWGGRGSGKDFCLYGSSDCTTLRTHNANEPEPQGLVWYCMNHIFEKVEEGQSNYRNATMECTFVDCVKSRFEEMLGEAAWNQKSRYIRTNEVARMRVRQDKKGATYLVGSVERSVRSRDDIGRWVLLSQVNRIRSITHMSKMSGVDNSVISIHLETSGEDGTVHQRTFHIVKCVAWTGSDSNHGVGPMPRINSYDLAWSRVLSRLGEGKVHVPFRDSPLAFLLQRVLLGEGETSFILTCNSDLDQHEARKSVIALGDLVRRVPKVGFSSKNKECTGDGTERALGRPPEDIDAAPTHSSSPSSRLLWNFSWKSISRVREAVRVVSSRISDLYDVLGNSFKALIDSSHIGNEKTELQEMIAIERDLLSLHTSQPAPLFNVMQSALTLFAEACVELFGNGNPSVAEEEMSERLQEWVGTAATQTDDIVRDVVLGFLKPGAFSPTAAALFSMLPIRTGSGVAGCVAFHAAVRLHQQKADERSTASSPPLIERVLGTVEAMFVRVKSDWAGSPFLDGAASPAASAHPFPLGRFLSSCVSGVTSDEYVAMLPVSFWVLLPSPVCFDRQELSKGGVVGRLTVAFDGVL